MITSKQFLTEIQSIYSPQGMMTSATRIIAQWCNEYYQKYSEPPGKAIEDIFRERKDIDLDSGTIDEIELFLSSISDEYETGDKFNSKYILDKAEKYFRLSALENLRMDLTQTIIGNRVEDGEELISNFRRVTKIETVGVDPFFDTSKIIEALDDDSGDQLFKLYGKLGEMIGELERGYLMGIVGAPAAGKTWWLLIIALRALFAGYKVLFLSLEMSEKQIIRRIMHWMTGLPIKKYAGKLLLPVFDCLWNQTNECIDECDVGIINSQSDTKPKFHKTKNYKPCTKCRGTSEYEPATWFEQKDKEPLDIAEALKKRKILSRMSIIRSNRFKIAQFPSGELTMTQLKTYIHNLEYYNGFIPDVIITDYADKFKAEKYREYRHGLNEIWEGHKSLAQEKNCLVVTASQTNTARTGKDIVQGSWAEDIRKLNLIDVGFAINQTPEEKLQGYYRCGVLKQRHEDFNLLGEVCVLNCLKIGRPYLDSEKVNWKKDEKK